MDVEGTHLTIEEPPHCCVIFCVGCGERIQQLGVSGLKRERSWFQTPGWICRKCVERTYKAFQEQKV